MWEKTLYAHFAGSERSGESEDQLSAPLELHVEERIEKVEEELQASGDVQALAPRNEVQQLQTLERTPEVTEGAEVSEKGSNGSDRESQSEDVEKTGRDENREDSKKTPSESGSSSDSTSSSSSTSRSSSTKKVSAKFASKSEDLEAGEDEETTPLIGADPGKLSKEAISPKLWSALWRCSRCSLCVAVPGLLVVSAWNGLCWTSGWNSWSACTAMDPTAKCGPGLRTRERQRRWGQCTGSSFTQNAPCDLGLCELDAFTTASTCNAQVRDSKLRQLPDVYGSTWQVLEECGAHICCHPCNGVRVAQYVTCAHQDIGPVPLVSLDGCFSCFPAPDSNYSCDGVDVCRKSFATKGSNQDLCCFAISTQINVTKKEKQAWVKGPDEVNFKRHPGTNAVLGKLDDFDSWPTSPNERSCQNTCWENTFCYIYVYLSEDADNPRSRGRCLSWRLSMAERAGRASPTTWMLETGAFSGLKLIPRLAVTTVLAQTSSGPGSGSRGTFVLLICESPTRCQDRKPLQLTPSSCDDGLDCLSTGQKASFVQNIVVPSSFRLHGVRVETFSDASWTIESLQVTVDGQEGHFSGGATVDKSRPLFFSVGCVTEDSPMVSGGTPCMTKCIHSDPDYCFVDEEKKTWGYCSPACDLKEQKVKVKSEMTCAELNWPTRSEYNEDGAVCAASSDRPLKGCSGHVTWSSAQKTCKEVGARLCTQDELEADEAAGSGCSMDQTHVWSSSKCGTNQFMTVAGAARYRNRLAPRCTVADEPLAHTRCCADALILTISFSREDRDTHSLPSGLNTENPGGLMNWVVVSGTNWKGRPGFFLQSGMHGRLAPRNSQHLDVMLSGVNTAPRGGIIQFYYRIESERRVDLLRFFIDEMEQTSHGFPVSGKISWTRASFSFSGSRLLSHNFRWRYEKDGSDSIGRDVACIDAIVVHGIRGLE